MSKEPIVPLPMYVKSIPLIVNIQRTLNRTTPEDAREIIHEALRLYHTAVNDIKLGCDIGSYDKERCLFKTYAVWPILD